MAGAPGRSDFDWKTKTKLRQPDAVGVHATTFNPGGREMVMWITTDQAAEMYAACTCATAATAALR